MADLAEWTTKGNISPSLLDLEVLWEDTPSYTKVTFQYSLKDTKEIVRTDVAVMGKFDMVFGAEQASFI
jgi:predicted HAD superfamily hydrolase